MASGPSAALPVGLRLANTPRARDQLAAQLSDMERELGPDHPDTLGTRHQLAVCTALANPSAGRDQLATLLPDMERVLGGP